MPEVLLGFDYGSHKIGVAVGQLLTGTANALTTVQQVKNKPDWDSINRLVEEWQPQAMVVGLPHQMNDQESEMAEPAKRFARQLHGRYQLPVYLIDWEWGSAFCVTRYHHEHQGWLWQDHGGHQPCQLLCCTGLWYGIVRLRPTGIKHPLA